MAPISITTPNRLCLALAALLWCTAAAAQPIEAEGAAPIGPGGRDQARQQAIRDALYQASLGTAAQVEGSSSVNGAGEVRESVRVSTSARAANPTVVQEWESHGALHVLIRADIQDAGSPCGAGTAPVAATKHRKKLAVTRFYAVDSLQVEDIPDIWNGYPLELLRRLAARGGALPINASPTLLPGGREANPDSPSNRDLIRRLAEQTGSQFVISGVILDAGFGADTLHPYIGWQGNESGRRSEIGLPWPAVAAGVRPAPSERRLDVEIYVHDGLTGALVARTRHSAMATGQVQVGRSKPFASAAFFATAYGRVVDQAIDRQAAELSHDLDCLPFAANVVRIDGARIYLDAGATSGLAPGDKLTLYRRDTFAPVAGLSTAALGIPETPAGIITLTQVQPLFSVAALPPEAAGIQVGDVARAMEPGEKNEAGAQDKRPR